MIFKEAIYLKRVYFTKQFQPQKIKNQGRIKMTSEVNQRGRGQPLVMSDEELLKIIMNGYSIF